MTTIHAQVSTATSEMTFTRDLADTLTRYEAVTYHRAADALEQIAADIRRMFPLPEERL